MRNSSHKKFERFLSDFENLWLKNDRVEDVQESYRKM